MVKRRAYRELPDEELPAEADHAIRAMIDAAEQDITERRARGELRPSLSKGEQAARELVDAEAIASKQASNEGR